MKNVKNVFNKKTLATLGMSALSLGAVKAQETETRVPQLDGNPTALWVGANVMQDLHNKGQSIELTGHLIASSYGVSENFGGDYGFGATLNVGRNNDKYSPDISVSSVGIDATVLLGLHYKKVGFNIESGFGYKALNLSGNYKYYDAKINNELLHYFVMPLKFELTYAPFDRATIVGGLHMPCMIGGDNKKIIDTAGERHRLFLGSDNPMNIYVGLRFKIGGR